MIMFLVSLSLNCSTIYQRFLLLSGKPSSQYQLFCTVGSGKVRPVKLIQGITGCFTQGIFYCRFEVFTAVTVKNAVFWASLPTERHSSPTYSYILGCCFLYSAFIFYLDRPTCSISSTHGSLWQLQGSVFGMERSACQKACVYVTLRQKQPRPWTHHFCEWAFSRRWL
jgi:hypothetical protein